MKTKGVLLRKCIGCNEMKTKSSLIRICKTIENKVKIDESYKMEGRGAYICNNNLECLEKSIKFNKISRALKADVPSDITMELQKKIGKI